MSCLVTDLSTKFENFRQKIWKKFFLRPETHVATFN
jgi:hypothetical protein